MIDYSLLHNSLHLFILLISPSIDSPLYFSLYFSFLSALMTVRLPLHLSFSSLLYPLLPSTLSPVPLLRFLIEKSSVSQRICNFTYERLISAYSPSFFFLCYLLPSHNPPSLFFAHHSSFHRFCFFLAIMIISVFYIDVTLYNTIYVPTCQSCPITYSSMLF